MRVHHLNGSTLCPVGRGLSLGDPGGRLVCHCLLIETSEGLVLVDTALGLEDIHAPTHESVRQGMGLMGPKWDPEQTMARQRPSNANGASIRGAKGIKPSPIGKGG